MQNLPGRTCVKLQVVGELVQKPLDTRRSFKGAQATSFRARESKVVNSPHAMWNIDFAVWVPSGFSTGCAVTRSGDHFRSAHKLQMFRRAPDPLERATRSVAAVE